MSLYQGNEGPTNDPGHAVEHLLYDVVVQVLPWREGFLLESGQLWFVNKFFRRQYLIIVFSPPLCGQEKKSERPTIFIDTFDAILIEKLGIFVVVYIY